MREQTERLGTSVVLGYPYDDAIRKVAETWRDTAELSEMSLEQGDMAIIDWLLSKSCGTFYVIRDSNWHALLKDRIASGKIRLCGPDEAKGLIFEKKAFVFLDMREVREGIGHEMLQTFDIYPPAVLSVRHVNVLKTHFKYISGVADLLDSTARQAEKSFVMLAMTYEEIILADLLYAMSNKLSAIMKCGTNRMVAYSEDHPFVYERQLTKIPKNKYIFFACNAFGVHHYARRIFLYNRKCDYYFLHGAKRVQSNACLAHKPFILWAYPFAGTGRILPVFAEVLNFLGIAVSDNRIAAPSHYNCWPMFYEYNFRENADDIFKCYSVGMLNLCHDDYVMKNRVLDIYRIMPPSSCLYLHCSCYHMADILRETGSMAVVLTRDMRDIAYSCLRFFYSGLIKYKGWSPVELLMKGLGEGEHLEVVSRALVEIRDNPQARFIKFEDVCASPLEAYRQLFSNMGIADDPYFIPEIVDEQLMRKIQEVSPEDFSDKPLEDVVAGVKYQLDKRKPGAWREVFTQEVKDYFKQHDNGILKAFGYEQDDAW